MEPTIYNKPSIYNGAGIYKTGAEGGGGGGFTPISGSVELFGKVYNTVKINGLEWICENLDYKWDGLAIGHNTTSQQACYTQDNESLWGWNGRKCGLLYNKSAKEQLSNNLIDWRIPSLSDYDKLCVATKSYFDAYYKLTKNVDWSSRNGDDIFDFSEMPCGAYESGWQDINEGWYIHSQSNIMVYSRPYPEYTFMYGHYYGNWYLPIRLCRDV